MPTDPTIACPNCATDIKLTESLAAPLIKATREEFEKRIELQSVELYQSKGRYPTLLVPAVVS